MTLLDLSQVTRSLANLIELHVEASPVWPAATNLLVSPQPPDKLTGENTLGLHLYHITESAAFKNLPPPGRDEPPVRYSPMGLELYYQLTPHSDLDLEGAYREQLILGCALKALHDYPMLDDSTQIGGSTIFTTALQGGNNHLCISLQPLSANDAVDYWTAGTSPLRLSAYYQVSVVLLEPEDTSTRARRVLSYGAYTFTAQTPRLDGSRNILTYNIPGETGPREVELRPAQVPIGGRITFDGASLVGETIDLVLRNQRWEEPVTVDANWNISVAGEQLWAEVRATAGGQDILPGVYGASVRVERRRQMPDGQTRDFIYVSNESPFLITPDIQAITPPTATGVVSVTGRIFHHSDLAPEHVQVYVGEERLTTGAAGALNQGEFAVIDANNLELRLPSGLIPGSLTPVRIFVNRAESPPNWVIAP